MADFPSASDTLERGETAPRRRRLAPRQSPHGDRHPPAIFRAQTAADLARASELGFSHLLISDSALLETAGATGLAVLMDIALDTPNPALQTEHPDWFVHGATGPVLRFLSEHDAPATWWDDQLAAAQNAGAAGFLVRRAHTVPATSLRHLIGQARRRDSETILIAECFGASPAQIDELAFADFDFALSSSCFWDFSASWLNEDSERISALGPAIACAAPPCAMGWTQAATLRALRFAAMFAPGWLVDAEFCADSGLDQHIIALNELRATHPALRERHTARLLSSPGADIAVLERAKNFVITINASLDDAAVQSAAAVLPALQAGRLRGLDASAADITAADAIGLAPGDVKIFEALADQPICLPAPRLDCDAPRIAIESITPQVDAGKAPVRRTVGELVTIEADLIADGHDKLAGEILIRAADEKKFRAYPLSLINNDRWTASVPLERLGRHVFVVTAWKDAFASLVDEIAKKHAAGIPTQLELREGLALVDEAAARDKKLRLIAERLHEAAEPVLREALLSDKLATFMRQAAPRKFLVRSPEIIIDAERLGASFASWYEIFPRSQSGDPTRHGTFRDVITQLPRIAAMGFDVLYFPPIHPIGAKNRKGKNNTLTPAPEDPGSPYAIGSSQGGHDALHPELGSLEDFRALVAAAAKNGLELALDFAIQCAPDHPWLTEHPEWFDWRPDGSIRYAENPPKKYEDIVNVDFYTDGAKPALWLALRDVVQFWVDQGIRLFRVDNPHTKPFPFWAWLIADIRARHPDTVFLAEAFTRPKIMYRLAKVGFSQSYTYFTWRHTKQELTEYLTELTTTAPKDFFRPHFFVNTPDINPLFLQTAGRSGFLIRAALAATLSGLWGVYNGFELCEAQAVPGKEEYFASEKYEIKVWDYNRPGNIIPEITALNRIRKANAALHSHLGVEFLPSDNNQVLYFRKFAPGGNTLLIAISLDPQNIQDATIELPLWRFGLPDDGQLAAEDLIRGHKFIWRGKFQPVHLNPSELPFCIWRVAPAHNSRIP